MFWLPNTPSRILQKLSTQKCQKVETKWLLRKVSFSSSKELGKGALTTANSFGNNPTTGKHQWKKQPLPPGGFNGTEWGSELSLPPNGQWKQVAALPVALYCGINEAEQETNLLYCVWQEQAALQLPYQDTLGSAEVSWPSNPCPVKQEVLWLHNSLNSTRRSQ